MNTEKLSNENETEALNKHGVMQGLADYIKERKLKLHGLIKLHRQSNNIESVRKIQTRLSELVIIETAIEDLQLASPTVADGAVGKNG
jgi:hypothetical protein